MIIFTAFSQGHFTKDIVFRNGPPSFKRFEAVLAGLAWLVLGWYRHGFLEQLSTLLYNNNNFVYSPTAVRCCWLGQHRVVVVVEPRPDRPVWQISSVSVITWPRPDPAHSSKHGSDTEVGQVPEALQRGRQEPRRQLGQDRRQRPRAAARVVIRQELQPGKLQHTECSSLPRGIRLWPRRGQVRLIYLATDMPFCGVVETITLSELL